MHQRTFDRLMDASERALEQSFRVMAAEFSRRFPDLHGAA
jgi:hypothetical protein